MGQAMNLRDVKVVARFELSRVMGTAGGALFVALGGMVYAFVLFRLSDMATELANPNVKMLAAEGADFVAKAIEWWTDLESGDVATLLADHNPILLTFFMVGLMLTPFLAIMASFDQTGTDIATRHIRYLLLRTDRASLYMGKIVATTTFYAVGMALVTIAAGLVVGSSYGLGDGGILYLVRIWLTLVGFALPFIAFTAMCSAMTGHGGISLLVAIGVQLFVFLVAGVGTYMNPSFEQFKYVFASVVKYDFAADNISTIGFAVAYSVGWGALMFFIGRATFARRDV